MSAAGLSTVLVAIQLSYKGEVLTFPGGDLKKKKKRNLKEWDTTHFTFFLFSSTQPLKKDHNFATESGKLKYLHFTELKILWAK